MNVVCFLIEFSVSNVYTLLGIKQLIIFQLKLNLIIEETLFYTINNNKPIELLYLFILL